MAWFAALNGLFLRPRVEEMLQFIAACVAIVAWLCPGIIRPQPSAPELHLLAGESISVSHQAGEGAAKQDSTFRDCVSKCPLMMTIPAGKFIMGSPDEASSWPATGRPQHEVIIAEPFAVSKFEVTYAEWDACVSAAACPHVQDSWGRGEMPVTNVSWANAHQFIEWLSRLSGKEYRLLNEAEWEYVARAGAATRYAWGDDVGKGRANCDDCGSRWDGRQTAPVGSFKPNAFGLFDLHGNVWEWVEDSWHDNYKGAPIDGTAWVEGGDPNFRVIRGGAWRNEPELVRVDARVKRIIHVQFDTLGFRVARTLHR